MGHPGFHLEDPGNGWTIGRFEALTGLGLVHAVTTLRGPDVHAIRIDPAGAVQRLAETLGLREGAFLNQVHGARTLVCRAGGCAGEADGLCTDVPGLLLAGKSGDCPIVLVADRRGRAVGFAHASWRATVAGIVPSLVARMTGALGCRPEDLVACIAPSVGPECYEVGPEVRQSALDGIGGQAADFFRPGPRKWHFDLWAANTDALCRAGLCRQDVHVAGLCTLCRDDLFPSHRRQGGGAGRFLVGIGLKDAGDKMDIRPTFGERIGFSFFSLLNRKCLVQKNFHRFFTEIVKQICLKNIGRMSILSPAS